MQIIKRRKEERKVSGLNRLLKSSRYERRDDRVYSHCAKT
jgi:hypothetical protein